MADIAIVARTDQYRMVTDGSGRFAVIEARAGKVYSLHPQGRRVAADTPEGMALVIGPEGWQAREAAERRFDAMTAGEERYAERLR